MKIAIYTPQPEPKYKIELGDVIVAKSSTVKGRTLYYKLIQFGRTGKFYLLNLGTNLIMESFESTDLQSAIDYVQISIKANIMEVVPSDKLELTLNNPFPKLSEDSIQLRKDLGFL